MNYTLSVEEASFLTTTLVKFRASFYITSNQHQLLETASEKLRQQDFTFTDEEIFAIHNALHRLLGKPNLRNRKMIVSLWNKFGSFVTQTQGGVFYGKCN